MSCLKYVNPPRLKWTLFCALKSNASPSPQKCVESTLFKMKPSHAPKLPLDHRFLPNLHSRVFISPYKSNSAIFVSKWTDLKW